MWNTGENDELEHARVVVREFVEAGRSGLLDVVFFWGAGKMVWTRMSKS